MFENKESGWKKSKEEDKEIKKKADIEASVTKQAEEKKIEQEESSRNDYYDNRGKGGRGGYNDYDNKKGGDRRNDKYDKPSGGSNTGKNAETKYQVKDKSGDQPQLGRGKSQRYNDGSKFTPKLDKQ